MPLLSYNLCRDQFFKRLKKREVYFYKTTVDFQEGNIFKTKTG